MTHLFGERHDGDGRTFRAIRHIQAKPAANMPAILVLDAVNDSGVIIPYYIWVDSNGVVRESTTLPTNQDSDGAALSVGSATATKLADAFTLEGGTYDPPTTITAQTTSAAALSIPDLGGVAQEWVFSKVAQTLTNKTIVAGSNTISGITAAQLATAALTIGTYGVPWVIVAVNAGAAINVIFNANCPYKLRIIDVHAVATKACNGTWKLDNGTNDITGTTAYGVDTTVSRVGTLNDAYHGLAANATLRLISSDATDTAIVYITVLRET